MKDRLRIKFLRDGVLNGGVQEEATQQLGKGVIRRFSICGSGGGDRSGKGFKSNWICTIGGPFVPMEDDLYQIRTIFT